MKTETSQRDDAIDNVIKNLRFPGDSDPESPSLREQLLRFKKQMGSVEEIRQKILEAKGTASPETADFFTEIARWGDKLLQKDMPQEALFLLSWPDWVKKIRELFDQGDWEAEGIMKILEVFIKNSIFMDNLWRITVKIERPCRAISNYYFLEQLLENLAQEEKLAQRLTNPYKIPEKGIIIEKGYETRMYLPARNNPTARLGWQFIKKAEARAKERSLKRKNQPPQN